VSVHKKCINCEFHSPVSDSSRPFSFTSIEKVLTIKLIFEFRSIACVTKNVIDSFIVSLIQPPVNNFRDKDVICRSCSSLKTSQSTTKYNGRLVQPVVDIKVSLPAP